MDDSLSDGGRGVGGDANEGRVTAGDEWAGASCARVRGPDGFAEKDERGARGCERSVAGDAKGARTDGSESAG